MQVDREPFSVRDLVSDDWSAVAALLGRDTAYGMRLARHVEATYRPSFGWVVPTPDPSVIDAAVVAGVRRRTADGSPAAVTIAWVGVSPERRRAGIGRHLLNRVASGATRLGARRIEATVDVRDPQAMAFFHASEFEDERRTAEVRIAADDAKVLGAALAPPDVVVRPLRHDELPALSGLLIHLAVERATAPHDDLDGLTPYVLSAASMHADHVAVAAWDANDLDAPLGLAWGSRRADGLRLDYIGVHEDARRRGIGRALLGGLLITSRQSTVLARVHEPVPLHGFLVRIGAVVTAETVDLSRTIGGGNQ